MRNIKEILVFHSKHWRPIGVFFLLLTAFAAWLKFTDSYVDEAKEHLLSSGIECEGIGKIGKLSHRKTITIYRPSGVGNAQEPDQKIYRFVAVGNSGKGVIEVKFKISKTDQAEPMQIIC